MLHRSTSLEPGPRAKRLKSNKNFRVPTTTKKRQIAEAYDNAALKTREQRKIRLRRLKLKEGKVQYSDEDRTLAKQEYTRQADAAMVAYKHEKQYQPLREWDGKGAEVFPRPAMDPITGSLLFYKDRHGRFRSYVFVHGDGRINRVCRRANKPMFQYWASPPAPPRRALERPTHRDLPYTKISIGEKSFALHRLIAFSCNPQNAFGETPRNLLEVHTTLLN